MEAGAELPVRLSVRRPQPGDARALAEFELICFSDPWPSQFFVSEILAEGRFNRLLVDPAGEIVAYLFCAWRYLDLHVLKVATLPPFRRTGIARRLMAHAEDHVAEVGGQSLTLEVRASNQAAAALYDALGYDRTGRRSHYYPDGEDALIMMKRVGTVEL